MLTRFALLFSVLLICLAQSVQAGSAGIQTTPRHVSMQGINLYHKYDIESDTFNPRVILGAIPGGLPHFQLNISNILTQPGDIIHLEITGAKADYRSLIAPREYAELIEVLDDEPGKHTYRYRVIQHWETAYFAFTVEDSGFRPVASDTPYDVTAKVIGYRGQSGEKYIESDIIYDMAFLRTQFEVRLAKAFDEVIDLRQDSLGFESENKTVSFAVDVDDRNTLLKSAEIHQIEFVVTGEDLSFLRDLNGNLDSNKLIVETLTESGPAADSASNSELSDDNKTLIVRPDRVSQGLRNGANNYSVTFDLTDNLVELNKQSFDIDVNMGYRHLITDLTPNQELADVYRVAYPDAAQFEINGTEFDIAYMPYGRGISQIISVSNSGSRDAEILLSGFDDAGNQFGPVTLDVMANSGRVTNLKSSVLRALEKSDAFTGNGKLHLTLTIDADSESLDLFTASNVLGQRVTALNTKN